MSEEVEKEIEAKIIEKQPLPAAPEPEPVPSQSIKPKKERTQAQKDAFEKARKKRMENIAAKKEEEAKQPKKPRGRPRKKKGPLQPAADLVKPENYPRPVQHQPHPAVNHNIPYQGGIVGTMPPAQYYQPQPQPPPQVHNYYYGVNPPQREERAPAPPEAPDTRGTEQDFTSSEEESSEDELDYGAEGGMMFNNTPETRYYEPPAQPTMKYRFG
tara:strand:- start:4685 stop:5326 length:642 start_codon:yes stop_codon:yes gene_type:complete